MALATSLLLSRSCNVSSDVRTELIDATKLSEYQQICYHRNPYAQSTRARTVLTLSQSLSFSTTPSYLSAACMLGWEVE